MSVALFIQPVVNTTMTHGDLVFEELWLILKAEKKETTLLLLPGINNTMHSYKIKFKTEELINNLPASSGVWDFND